MTQTQINEPLPKSEKQNSESQRHMQIQLSELDLVNLNGGVGITAFPVHRYEPPIGPEPVAPHFPIRPFAGRL